MRTSLPEKALPKKAGTPLPKTSSWTTSWPRTLSKSKARARCCSCGEELEASDAMGTRTRARPAESFDTQEAAPAAGLDRSHTVMLLSPSSSWAGAGTRRFSSNRPRFPTITVLSALLDHRSNLPSNGDRLLPIS